MSEYYKYESDFENKEDTWKLYSWDKYPSDIKRIISTCDGSHTFYKRLYFFSESQRIVYQIGSDPLKFQERGDGTHVYCLIDDYNKRYSFFVSDFLIAITSNMSKIELPKKYR